MLLLFHNRQAVLTKGQLTIATDQSLQPTASIMLPSDQARLLFGREKSKESEKHSDFSDLPLCVSMTLSGGKY